jgi:hypothetical protein
MKNKIYQWVYCSVLLSAVCSFAYSQTSQVQVTNSGIGIGHSGPNHHQGAFGDGRYSRTSCCRPFRKAMKGRDFSFSACCPIKCNCHHE